MNANDYDLNVDGKFIVVIGTLRNRQTGYRIRFESKLFPVEMKDAVEANKLSILIAANAEWFQHNKSIILEYGELTGLIVINQVLVPSCLNADFTNIIK